MSATRRRVTFVIAAGIVLAALVSASSRLRLDADLSRMIPDADPRLGKAALVARSLLERLTIDISADAVTSVTVQELARTADAIARDLASIGVRECNLLASEADTMRGLETLRDRASQVLDPSTLSQLEGRLTREAIEQRLRWLAQALQEPDGLRFGSRAASDPLGITDGALSALRDAAPAFKDARVVGKCIVSGDERRALLLLDPGFPASNVERTEILLARIHTFSESLRADPSSRHLRIRVLGAHRSTLDNVREITSDSTRGATLGLILATVFALLVYTSVWHVAVALVPALFGAALAAATFAVLRGSVAGAAAGFGSVLVGLTVDYANHAIFSLRARGRIDAGALLTSAATTVAAFLALTASSLPVVREIGLFGAIGVVGAALSTFWVVPALAGRGTPARRAVVDLTAWVGRVKSMRGVRWLPVAFIAMTPMVLWHVPDLTFDGDVSHLNSLSPAAAEDESEILGAWEGGLRLTWIATEGRTLTDALDVNDRLARTLKQVQVAGGLLEYSSLTGLLPGPAEQHGRRDAWRAFWTNERIESLRRNLAASVAGTPFRADGFEPFFQWLAVEPAPLDADAERSGAFAGLIRDRIITTSSGVLVTTSVRTKDWIQVRELEQSLRTAVPEAIVLNRESLVRRVAEIVSHEMWLLGAIALVAVGLFAWFLLGSLLLAVVTVSPVAVSLLWTLGILGWLGIPMSLVNAVFTAFLVGAAVDYAIVLVHGRVRRWKSGVDETSFTDAAVLLNATTAGVGFGVLTFAGHPVLRSIGATAVVGIACAWGATQALVPAMAGLFLRRRGPGGILRLRNVASTLWVLWQLLRTKVYWSCFEKWRTAPDQRQFKAIQRIHELSVRLRDGVPFCTTTHVGMKSISLETPTIIVANHESYYDSVALAALPVPVAAFVKGYVGSAPLLGPLVRDAGYVVTDHVDAAAMVDACRELIARGISPIVFPEGTRSKSGGMARFRNGAFLLSRTLGVPITPVALVNTGGSVRPLTWWVGDFDARVVVLDALHPQNFAGEGGERRMARVARDLIRTAIRDHWLETQLGDSWKASLSGLFELVGPSVRRSAVRQLHHDKLLRVLPLTLPGHDRVLVYPCGLGVSVGRLAMAYPGREIVGVAETECQLEMLQAALSGLANVTMVKGWNDLLDRAKPTSILLDQVDDVQPVELTAELVARLVEFVTATGRIVLRTSSASTGQCLPTNALWCTLLTRQGFRACSTPVNAASGGDLVMCFQAKECETS